jgi:6-pyruvoyltetrahydropterin/6-carboxytetrahydropterin synthase
MSNTFGVWKEIEFDAGHRVPDHASKCRNPHGHRYKVRALVVGPLQEEGSANGMVVDFGEVKEALVKYVHDKFDHGFIVYYQDNALMSGLQLFSEEADEKFKIILFPLVPTAENLAAWIYSELVCHTSLDVRQVEVYETPTSVAVYPL